MVLYSYQLDAVDKMKNGCVLCGGVGSGKSRTALTYYLLKECEGSVPITISGPDEIRLGDFRPMRKPRDLYIITTAKKRDSLEWQKELAVFTLPDAFGARVTIDSWNNIKKYDKNDLFGAFFIFDEQRVVGKGAWVRAFLRITRKNHWILLSATPGDTWSDYIPVFLANGFYKNRSEFHEMHCVFSRFSKYPKIEKYVGTKLLERHLNDILVPMKDLRITKRHDIYVNCSYDRVLYKNIFVNRWDPWENEPIEESGKLLYLIRKCVNADESRIRKVIELIKEKKRVIIFYNYTYELDMLCNALESISCPFSEWNGRKHEEVPLGDFWAYLVQYSAGSEGWNCITCDTIIFYSQTYSYRTLEQASGRIDRINTPFTDLYYYHLKSSAPIDTAIYAKLKHKENFNERAFLRRVK